MFKEVKVNRTDHTFKLIDITEKDPQILVSVIVKNNAYSLPTFLKTLETLKCPNEKQKCDLWIGFNSTDKSYDIFTNWLANTREIFDSVLMLNTDNDIVTQEKHPEFDQLYFSDNLKLRALKYALDKGFNYVFFMYADTIIIEPDVIPILLNRKQDIIAPMLTAPQTFIHDKKYSTFTAFEHMYRKERSKSTFESYFDRSYKGAFPVKAVKDCYLFKVDPTILSALFKMNKKTQKNKDDDEAISQQLSQARIPMHVYNAEVFGYVNDKEMTDLQNNFAYIRMEHLLKGPDGTFNEPLPITEFLEASTRKTRRTKLGFNEIYVINLERRPDRRNRSEAALNDLNLSHKFVKAVDSRTLKEEILKELGIRILPNYRDPHSGRFLNYGEIGCFLSHYNIWKEVVEKNYERVVILEDDFRFELNFKSILNHVMNQINAKKIEWDLIYLGRRIMNSKEEEWNYDVEFKDGFGLRKPAFTWWAVAYALSLNGAKKLMESKPLLNMIPVDEYLPLMFDKPSNASWKSFYPNRNLITYAIQPSIIMPSHFKNDIGYVTDTENTPVLKPSKFDDSKVKELQNLDSKNILSDNLLHSTEL